MKQIYKQSISSRIMNMIFGLYHILTTQTLLDKQLPKASAKTYTPKKHFQKTTFHNIDVYSIKNESTTNHIFYLHGGAYVLSGQSFHFQFLRNLYKNLDCTIHYVDYPLAPDSTVSDTVSQTVDVIERYCTEHHINSLILMGDSAGAGLSVAVSQYLKSKFRIEHLVLLSPWLDLTLEDLYEVKDPILSKETLRNAAKMYADKQETTIDASPIFMEELPCQNITIITSTKDILHNDSVRFYDRYRNHVDLHIFENGMHDCAIFPFTKEQQITIQIISNAIRNR